MGRVIIGDGTSGGRQTVLLAGSPFDTLAELETYSQNNPSELLNTTSQVSAAIVTNDGSNNGNYVWGGSTGVYTANSWLFMSAGIPEEDQDVINSIKNLTPGNLPVAVTGGLEDSPATQEGEETIQAPEVKVNTNTLFLDSAWLIDSAGHGARMKNIGADEDFNIMFSRFDKERHPGLVRVRNGDPLNNNNDFTLPINTIDTDVLTDPEYTIPVIPSIGNEQGQTATTAIVKIDPSSILTKWVLEFSINDTLYTVFKQDVVTSGDFVFTYNPEIDIPTGAKLTVKIYSTDGDVKMLGDSVTGFPYILQNVQQYNDKEIYHLEDQIPTYKDSSTPANELFINNVEVIAADASNGGFTLQVDPTVVNSFTVFDYAGNINSFARQVDVEIIGGDTFELDRRNRKWFFYKDEDDIWRVYEQLAFRGL